ncbi:MAG: hypothetical protein KatS3mg113_0955 [Planctomycetaceae bacterium]|nr:MAG: hypothetical protein KatS3mg113_0955 [Planctomycetaceae bacterium]
MARISSGTMTVVIFAILIGLGGAFIIRQELAKPQATPPAKRPTPIVVPVASMDLEPGQKLTIHEIALLTYSPEKYAESRYSKLTYMRNPQQIIGRTLKMGLRKGEVFSPEFLYPEGYGPGISERLQAGYRAVTVPVENIGAVQGFARPGTWVDVLFRSKAEGRRPELTFTLLERVEVLAINESLLPNQMVDTKTVGSVTLAVTPSQARVLKVVEGRGELSLALRNPDDTLDLAPYEVTQRGDAWPGRHLLPGTLAMNIGWERISHSEATGRVERGYDLIDRSHSERERIERERERASREENKEKNRIDEILGSSRERLTLDDLLGLGREPTKRKMEIFLGPAKTVLEFEDAEEAVLFAPPTGTSSSVRPPVADIPRNAPLSSPAATVSSRRGRGG